LFVDLIWRNLLYIPVEREILFRLSLISGHPMLVPAAIGAVKQWHYKPYYFNGKSADVQTEININFSLSGQ
jgi:TonB-like protein